MLELSANPEMVEEVDCLFCGSGRKGAIKTRNQLRIVRCLDCGLIYTDRRLNRRGLELYYQEGYFTGQRRSSFRDYDAERPEKLLDFRRKYALLKRHGGPGKLLDVGCATGFSLEAAAAEGFDPAGVELSRWAAGQNRSGFPVYNCDLVEMDPSVRYDAISLWDVIEHFLDPEVSFRMLGLLLGDGGRLAFTYPDPASLFARAMGRRWSIFDPEEHAVFYSRRILSTWLGRHGFTRVLDRREERSFTLRKLAQKTFPFLERHIAKAGFGGRVVRFSIPYKRIFLFRKVGDPGR